MGGFRRWRERVSGCGRQTLPTVHLDVCLHDYRDAFWHQTLLQILLQILLQVLLSQLLQQTLHPPLVLLELLLQAFSGQSRRILHWLEQ